MKKSLKLRLLAITGATVGVVGTATAAVPAAVSTALTDAASDAATVAGLFLVAIVGIAAFGLMRRGVS